MESHYRRRIRSWITGHHAYKNIWSPTIGEELDHRRRIRSWITGHHAYKNIWSPTIGEELDHG